jgi:hypothetical protein
MPASPLVANYDPKKVIVTLGGVPFGGYADGTFISVAPNDADGFKKVVGADGEVCRAQSSDNTHTITVTLLMSSETNAYLSGIRNTDKLTGKSILPLSITDLSGSLVAFWPQAWIKGDPTWEFGKEVNERQWVLDTGQQASDTKAGVLP